MSEHALQLTSNRALDAQLVRGSFSGTQLLLLGVVGEYIGRTYLRVSEKPQSVVRHRREHVPANLDLTKRGF